MPWGAENSKIGRRQGASIASALQGIPLTRGPVTDTHLKVVTLTPLQAGSALVLESDNKRKWSNHLKSGGRKLLLLRRVYVLLYLCRSSESFSIHLATIHKSQQLGFIFNLKNKILNNDFKYIDIWQEPDRTCCTEGLTGMC